MTQHNGDREPWDACPAGELGQMVARDRHRRRRQAARKLAGVSVVAVLLIAGGLLIANRFREQFAGNLWCHDVQQHIAAYHRGELDADLAQRMRTHLAACPGCQARYRQMREALDNAARNGNAERPNFVAWSRHRPALARRY